MIPCTGLTRCFVEHEWFSYNVRVYKELDEEQVSEIGLSRGWE